MIKSQDQSPLNQNLLDGAIKICQIFSNLTCLETLDALCNKDYKTPKLISVNQIVTLVKQQHQTKSSDQDIRLAITDLIEIKMIASTGEDRYYITQLGINLLHQIMQASKKLALKSESIFYQ